MSNTLKNSDFAVTNVHPSAYPNGAKKIESKPDQQQIVKAIQTSLSEKIEKPRFDFVPTENPEDAIPGSITIIYKNASKMRVNKKKSSVDSINPSEKERLDNELAGLTFLHVNDYSPPGVSEEDLQRDMERVSQKYEVEIPHRKSIHVYQFANDTNTKDIAQKLRKLPFVVTAYMTPKIEPGAYGELLSEHDIGSSETNPSDATFSALEINWWWFNRQKVFHAWKYLDQQVSLGKLSYSQPRIAVVDTGFDISPLALDSPNYASGESVKYDPFSPSPWTIGTNVQQLLSDHPGVNYSHGTMVASVAASPKNTPGLVSNLAGIAPQSTIIPYKLVSFCTNPSGGCTKTAIHEQTIAHAIFRASYSNADVINVSMQTAKRPISHTPAILNEILSAADNRQKVVVIIAGNGGVDLDTNLIASGQIPIQGYCNCVVVGGSERESAYHAKAWTGSSYNRVHVAAGASQIRGATFNPSTGIRSLRLDDGTSYAAPQVAATIGLMKKVAEGVGNSSLALDPEKLRNLVTYSATASRYSANASGTSTTSETKYLGEDLQYYGKNDYKMVGMRELNVYNAVVMAQFSNQYSAIARMHNIDDVAWLGFNGSWTDPTLQKSFGKDTIFGIKNIYSGNTINFATYNFGTSPNAISHGYQIYKNGENVYDWLGGVVYITGAQNNANVAHNSWHQVQSYTF